VFRLATTVVAKPVRRLPLRALVFYDLQMEWKIVRCELRLFFLAIVAWSALADSRYLYPKLNSKQIKEH
jgi:hypothetical protein